MEIWLGNNNDEDQAWIEGCKFNSNGYKLLKSNRSEHKRGGIILIHSENINYDQIDNKEMISFQYALWKCKLAKEK